MMNRGVLFYENFYLFTFQMEELEYKYKWDEMVKDLKNTLKKFNIPIDLLSRTLTSNRSKKLVEKLIRSASHPAEPVKIAIATVLGDTKDPRAIRTLANLVKDPAEKVRTSAPLTDFLWRNNS